MQFRREEINSFHATEYDFDRRTGIVLLRYELAGEQTVTFEERIDLGGPLQLDPAQEACFERVLRLLHAAAGTSYYKVAAPGVVAIESGRITGAEHQFIRDLYDKGLREFAYKNELPIPLQVEVRASVDGIDDAPGHDGGPQGGFAVPVGGGKDSIVVVDALRDLNPTLVAVNPAGAARRTAQEAGLNLVCLGRSLDPGLMELNRAGALNGHVPITAVISLVMVAAGYVHGYSTTLMALEGSADEPTRRVAGMDVNHQWSKSSECELELRQVLQGISPRIRYGSVLRELSELDISGAFAELSQYHDVFRSCNRAFALTGALDAWCNDCPKCRFVYLMLATSLPRADLVAIFGADLLGQPGQLNGFRDLLEEDRKPFECVGTRSESISAIEELAVSAQWADSPVVQELSRNLPDSRSTAPDRRSPQQVRQAVLDAARSIAGGDLIAATDIERIRSA
jgi:UDP-N-acetyl-alpha-D-muramoyl-L-alanyl-L-glutamate epimerase